MNNLVTPQNAYMVNQYTTTNDKTNCNAFDSPNNFGNYFDKCSRENASPGWGSNKPVKENCMNPQMGKPCHNIWNNSTKRKTIVDYDRGAIIRNINVPRQTVIPSNRGQFDPPTTPIQVDMVKDDIRLPAPLCKCDCNCR